MGSKSIEEQFRDQAELIDRRFSHEFKEQTQLIDRLFAYRFGQLDKRWVPRFASMERALGALEKDMKAVRESVSAILTKLS